MEGYCILEEAYFGRYIMEHLQTVQQIFADKLLRIPDYQRGYAWEKKHWNDFIEDLEILLYNQEHYTGTLVLHLNDSDQRITDQEGSTLQLYDVVDGQQRLITIIILLDCISKELKKIKGREILAEGIKKKYIKIIDIEKQEKSRLTLNKDCHDFFSKNIISEDVSIGGKIIKSHERLKSAQVFFSEYLKAKKQQIPLKYEDWLISLLNKITSFLKLTVYKVPSTSDVGVIFEVMNNRGKPLSEMEKVKNYLLYVTSKIPLRVSLELAEKINMTWSNIFKNLMESDASGVEYENQLLRSSWLMAYNYSSREWGGYSSIKEQFNLKKYSKNRDRLIKALTKYVDILNDACIAYCDIISPNRAGAYLNFKDKPKVQRMLRQKTEKLTRVGNLAPFLPLLMAVRLKYPDNYNFQEELLDICEKYAFRTYRLHNHRSNTGQYSLFRDGYNLYNRRRSPKYILNSVRNLLLSYSPDIKYKELFKLGEANWYLFYGLKYFLYEYEEHLAKGKGVQMPWDYLVKKDRKETIEHILPQTPNRPYWKERWDEDEIRIYLHDIGNLTLTFDNSVYGNKPFPEKRGSSGLNNCYANSNLFMERELSNFWTWTKRNLNKRRNKIVNWALQRWHVSSDFKDDFEPEEEEYDETESTFEQEDILQENETNGEELKEWTDEEIQEYLDYLKDYRELTYYYFKVLASVQDKICWDELKEKIKKLSDGNFTGRKFAGVQGGISQRTTKRGEERLDWRSEDRWKYSINKKYRNKIRRYFEQNK